MMIQGIRLVALLGIWIFLTVGCSTAPATKLRSRAEFEAGVAKALGVELDKISESEPQVLKSLGLVGDFKKDSAQAMTVGDRLYGMHVVTKIHERFITYLFYEGSDHAGPNWGFKLFLNYREDGSFADASGMRLIYPGKGPEKGSGRTSFPTGWQLTES